MNYERVILQVLMKAGNKGLKLQKIVRHVYNECNSMFCVLDFQEVYASVYQYLSKNCKTSQSPVEKLSFGVYRLNRSARVVQQLQLSFHEDVTATDSLQIAQETSGQNLSETTEDQSLPLFGEEAFL